MLFNNDLLYLSYPRVASATLNVVFAKAFKPPVYALVSKGQARIIAAEDRPGVFVRELPGHQTVDDARKILSGYGRTLDSFREIIVAVRNPYELYSSSYEFMRQQYTGNEERESFRLAKHNDFATFARNFRPRSLARWTQTDGGERLPNLSLLKIENMNASLRRILARNRIKIDFDIPKLNASAERPDFSSFGDEELRSIHTRTNEFFELGRYEKNSLPASEPV
ncbi:hypothetical protein HK107_10540 [Parvularcula sp. ZS-1/3]|uniref:Sulfotransferase family protein n=1 Tax=Parvularcula mediterranea TaxID=2732508 RepID=A0A7Y3RMD1_9PROT|nr:hypothetical protein [Parvularcula mediterranea]NNU16757.1 hypothetical protein [Parvularcula mediterranea]